MLGDEEHALRIILPRQYPNVPRIPARSLVLGRGREVLEQETHGGFHSLAFDLPQADLVDDRGRENGFRLAHLRVGVRVEEVDDLVACDAHADGAADGFACHFAGDHVRVAGGEAGEEGKDGYLEGGGSVGVEPIVGLDEDETLVVCGRVESGIKAGGCTAECAGVRGEGRGETGWVVVVGGGVVLIDYAKVPEIQKHLKLGLCKVGFAVRLAELETAKHEEKRKDVDMIHAELSSIVLAFQLVTDGGNKEGGGGTGERITCSAFSRYKTSIVHTCAFTSCKTKAKPSCVISTFLPFTSTKPPY